MSNSASDYNPFFNVRRGGPKEKRIRRVELMGEHKPKPIYYVKVTQQLYDGNYIDNDSLRTYFECVGEIGDMYRPVGTDGLPKEFAFVGFFQPENVSKAIEFIKQDSVINEIAVTAEEAKSWILELYPRNN